MNLWTDHRGRLSLAWRIVFGVLIVLAANFLAGGIANAAANSLRSFEVVFRPTLLILLLAWFSAMLLFADQVEENPLRALGLGRCHALSDSLVGICVGTACVALAVALMAAVGRVKFSATVTSHNFALLGAELFILATGAMAEEVTFRGYPFQRILEAAGPVAAIVVLSIFFGIAHQWNPHAQDVAVLSLLNTVFVGVLLAFAYLRRKNLWLPWGVHFGWNASLGVLLGLPVSGLSEFSVVVHGKATGPTWLTGGAYGIEGGVAGTLAIAFGFLPIYWFTRRRMTDAASPCESPQETDPHPSNR